MKSRPFQFAILACLALLSLSGCNNPSSPPSSVGYKVVDTRVASAQWSPDGRFLFYPQGGDNLTVCRYDTITGKVTRYHPGMEVYMFSVSPDNTRISLLKFVDGPGWYRDILVIDLESGKKTFVSRSDHYSVFVYWLNLGKLLVNLDNGRDEILDMHGHSLGRVPKQEIANDFFAYDATKLIYEDKRQTMHVFRFADGSDKVIYPVWPNESSSSHLKASMRMLSANGDIMVYGLDVDTGPHMYAMNVKTQKCVPIRLSYGGPEMGMSPDFTKYWFLIASEPSQLCLADTPPDSLRKIRSLMQKPNKPPK
jgi:hypothetical protein